MRGVLPNRDDQTDLPSPIPRRRAGFSKTTRSASPNKSKEIQMELLGFPWIRWGRIGAFQWVRANPNKKIFPPAPSRKRPCQGPHDFRQPGQDNTDSVSDKELVSKDCRPWRRRGRNWKARTGDVRQCRRQTFPSGKLGHATAHAMLRTICDVSPRRWASPAALSEPHPQSRDTRHR